MMTDDTHGNQQTPSEPLRSAATVTHLATRRRTEDILSSLTFVFGGVNYGTISISTPYTKGKRIVLYIVPRDRESGGEPVFAGPLDCLLTDDVTLAADVDVAR